MLPNRHFAAVQYICLLTLVFHILIYVFREEHTQRKIDKMIVEAKAKMAKGDKKGKDGYFIYLLYST